MKTETLEKLLSDSKIPTPWVIDNDITDRDGKTIVALIWEDGEYKSCTESDEKLICALRNAAPALIAIAKAAKAGPCRHTSDHRGGDCDLCKALQKFEEVES